MQKSLCVMPSKDGIQYFQDILDPGFMNIKLRFRRGDFNKLVLQLVLLSILTAIIVDTFLQYCPTSERTTADSRSKTGPEPSWFFLSRKVRNEDADLMRFEKDWITLMRRGAALRALEEVLGKNTPEELREKIRDDQINRGELLWQGKSGYCVAMCSCRRSDKQNALVLRLQGTKKETFFNPFFLMPLRSLLCTDLIPKS